VKHIRKTDILQIRQKLRNEGYPRFTRSMAVWTLKQMRRFHRVEKRLSSNLVSALKLSTASTSFG